MAESAGLGFAMVDILNAAVFTAMLCGFLAFIAVVILLSKWSIADAKMRGKSPILVCLAVVFFFPWGLVAWLLFRPEPVHSANSRRPFRLEDYRVQ